MKRLPRTLAVSQAGPTPWGDIVTEIEPSDRIRDNPKPKLPAAAPDYVLQPLAEVPLLIPVQSRMAEIGTRAMAIADIVPILDKFIEGVRSRAMGRVTRRKGLEMGTDWIRAATLSRNWLAGDPQNTPCPSPILSQGNSKLPYWQFVTLPGRNATCPGAGECWKDPNPKKGRSTERGWCYSFKAWRSPKSFFRQFNLTMLLRFPNKWHIIEALENAVKEDRADGKKFTTLRLYVDGDIDSIETLDFWMTTLQRFPTIQAYGYSKSWHIFLQYHKMKGGVWPSNYTLNLSTGGVYDKIPAMVEKMRELPIVRNRFMAIKIPKLKNPKTGRLSKIPQNILDTDMLNRTQRSVLTKSDDKIPTDIPEKAWIKNPVYQKIVMETVKAAGYKRFFVCPGKCGNCLKDGKHACGQNDSNWKQTPIFIGIH